jgi:hypothetical protein
MVTAALFAFEAAERHLAVLPFGWMTWFERVGGGVGDEVGEVEERVGVPVSHWEPEQAWPGSGEPLHVQADCVM